MPLDQIHFVRPYWLLAFIPLLLVVWMMLKKKLGNRSWEAVCDEALLPYILIGSVTRSRKAAIVLTGIGGSLAIIALAGPAWEKLPQPVFTTDNALVIALDLSRSMDANDITPSRIARARYKVSDILTQRKEGQTALLVYAGDAFTVTPLTDDNATIQSQLSALETEIMPTLGNRTDLAIELAVDLLKQAGLSTGDVLLISDEVDLERGRAPAGDLARQGYRLSVLGIGTSHGTPISLADGSFLKDHNGEIVIPVLDEKPMRQLVQAGNGRYYKMSMDDRDIDSIVNFLSGVGLKDNLEMSELETDVWNEQGPWLLLVLLPLVAIMFRRGFLAALIIFILPFPDTAQAFEWDSLWLNEDQRAKRVLEAGEASEAAEIFNDPKWKGVAQYRSEDFNGALESLRQTKDLESTYNAGNSLARLGEYEEAIKAYDQVLKQMPDHEDALFNKNLLEEELEQQQQQSGQDQQQDEREGQDKQESSDKEQQQQQGQDQEQQASNNENQSSEQEDGEQEQQEQEAQAQQQEQNQGEQTEQEQQEQLANAESIPPDEEEQATEQWLRRIPDDPAGLLRRKFLYQYKQRGQQAPANEKTW